MYAIQNLKNDKKNKNTYTHTYMYKEREGFKLIVYLFKLYKR